MTGMCAVCMKTSDAALRVGSATLCGTHGDAWLRSTERLYAGAPDSPEENRAISEFVRMARAELQNGSRR